MKDFYYILGTASNASPPEIDEAYHKLARKFSQPGGQPDEFIDSHFREIAEAYDVLRDANRRRKYDLALKRNQKRQLAIFKLKYLNIAATLIFVIVTAIFAAYVIRVTRSQPVKNKVAKSALVKPAPTLPVHAKRHIRPAVSIARKTSKKADTLHNTLPSAPPIAAHLPDSVYTTILHANITGIVYLHQSADYNSPVLAKIPDATLVRVLKKGQAYYKVEFNNQAGYVLKSCIAKP